MFRSVERRKHRKTTLHSPTDSRITLGRGPVHSEGTRGTTARLCQPGAGCFVRLLDKHAGGESLELNVELVERLGDVVKKLNGLLPED